MSFVRNFIKNPKATVSKAVGVATAVGAYVGGSTGFAATIFNDVRFPRGVNVVAKCSLFGAGKGLQYATLPITYPIAKHLESKGHTDTFLQTNLFDFSEKTAKAESEAQYRAKYRTPR